MICSKESNPQRQLYYLGARLLELFGSDENSIEFFDAYQKIKEKEDISVQLFILTIDWLYLLGAVKSEKGVIIKCF